MRGPPDHRTGVVIIAVFFALQFVLRCSFCSRCIFLHCSFFCVAVFFTLQFFLRCSFFYVAIFFALRWILGLSGEWSGWFDAGWGGMVGGV